MAEALQTEAVKRNLSVGQEVKAVISAHRSRLKLPSAISALEEVYRLQVVGDACGPANQIAEEMG